MTLLRVEHLSVRLQGRDVLRDVSLCVEAGECVGLIGPNGAGKTTLMRAALGLIPFAGQSSIADLAPRARAQAAAWMPQTREIAWPVDVETLVMLGRIPHLGAGQRPSPMDHDRVTGALRAMGLVDFRDRDATRLSGGEQARVLIARALAQDAPLILADEPVAGLDPAHQISTMATFAELARDGRGVIVSLHDLGLAARHCTRLILLSGQGIVADGPPLDVLTPERLGEVFGIRAWVQETGDGPVFQALDLFNDDVTTLARRLAFRSEVGIRSPRKGTLAFFPQRADPKFGELNLGEGQGQPWPLLVGIRGWFDRRLIRQSVEVAIRCALLK